MSVRRVGDFPLGQSLPPSLLGLFSENLCSRSHNPLKTPVKLSDSGNPISELNNN